MVVAPLATLAARFPIVRRWYRRPVVGRPGPEGVAGKGLSHPLFQIQFDQIYSKSASLNVYNF